MLIFCLEEWDKYSRFDLLVFMTGKAVLIRKGNIFFLLQDALKELWRLAYPNQQLPPLKSDLWKEMGWQNSDPSTDFRFL